LTLLYTAPFDCLTRYTTDGYMYVKQSKGAVYNSVKVS